MANSKEWEELWIKRIRESIEGLKYGVVQITVHDGKIVQIDRTERQRFEATKYEKQEPKKRLTKP